METKSELDQILRVGNIVVLEGVKNRNAVMRLTEQIMDEDFVKCCNDKLWNVRQATLIEKEFWFTGYDKHNIFGLFLDDIENWRINK